MGTNELIALLGTPAALGAFVAWALEYWDPFHALTPLGKKVAAIFGSMAVTWAIAGVGLWVGQLEASRELVVQVFMAGGLAFWASQAAHLMHHERK